MCRLPTSQKTISPNRQSPLTIQTHPRIPRPWLCHYWPLVPQPASELLCRTNYLDAPLCLVLLPDRDLFPLGGNWRCFPNCCLRGINVVNGKDLGKKVSRVSRVSAGGTDVLVEPFCISKFWGCCWWSERR